MNFLTGDDAPTPDEWEARVEAARQRVHELRREAEYHQRRVDSFNAQADQIERTWGLVETPAEPERPLGPPAFESFAEARCSIELAPPWEEPGA